MYVSRALRRENKYVIYQLMVGQYSGKLWPRSQVYIYIYNQLQRSLEPTAHLCPQRGSLMDSQSKPRRNVINYRKFRSDQGRTTLWMTFSLEEKLFMPWAGFEPTSPWLPVGCDHHYTIRATMLATWPIWIVSGNFLRGSPGLVFFSN